MHDLPNDGWRAAFGALPVEAPPADGWQRVRDALDARGVAAPAAGRLVRRHRLAGWLAVAAVLALAVALPRGPLAVDDDPPPVDTVAATGAAPPTTAELQAESALLEALLAHARDGRVATGSAAAMSSELEMRVAAIDAALADPTLAPDRERALWTERVQALQALTSFEGTRRWLAANGAQYDAALVQVN